MAQTQTNLDVQSLFEAGLHYGYSRTRRHPSSNQYLFGQKNRNDIFELAFTEAKLKEAIEVLSKVATAGGKVLFVGGKNEARDIVRRAAESCAMPYVAGRWIGGTLTNIREIRKRVDRLEKLITEKDTGGFEKYTKKERVLLDREIANLSEMFGGITSMKDRPQALFIVDPRHDDAAVREAIQLKIPVVALGNTDCDLNIITYPIPGNDATKKSIQFVADAVARALNSTVATQ
jgi:small subunit ribosomal protein S2